MLGASINVDGGVREAETHVLQASNLSYTRAQDSLSQKRLVAEIESNNSNAISQAAPNTCFGVLGVSNLPGSALLDANEVRRLLP